MIAERIPELKKLSLEEKIILAGEIWEEVSAHPEAFPPREDHLKILEERVAQYKRDPTNVRSWEDVKKSILGPG